MAENERMVNLMMRLVPRKRMMASRPDAILSGRALTAAGLVATAALMVLPHLAFAQYSGGAGSGPTSLGAAAGRTLRGAQGGTEKAIAPPPVVPGSKGAGEVANPTRTAAEMTPTEALFDAINRGDVDAARFAVRRGARIDARNELGLTPLDQSVDLGRNEITFMLLSERGDDPGYNRASQGGAAVVAGNESATSVSAPPARRARPAPARVIPDDDERPVARAATSPGRYEYSGNGGSAIPSAGFLGFNGR